MTDLTDEELIACYRDSGDLRHVDTLVQRHVGGVRAMIYPMVLNATDADDVTQDVFLRVVRNLACFRGDARFSTWLHRIAINAAIDFLRRRNGRPVAPAGEACVPPLADGAAGPDARAAARDEHSRVTRALAALPPHLRSAIMLTVLEGHPVRVAARMAGCLPATLYWRVHEARRRLKREMGE
ncbi:MAG: RNA polymerase sigma factor [Lentisphaerae bacterium]|nr:RNA polymerase sigma factor [Lentisphaerota bacterium]